MPNKKGYTYKNAHRLFKQLKVGMKKENDLTDDEVEMLHRYFPFMFGD